MRLHQLEVQAFQAFGGRESVDFDRLSADGLFLLRGDTGAGKTTLLDAICFAFYGELPGARSADARVRSDHAVPDLRTEVVVEASVRGTRLRITRSPAQERPKARGTGLTKEAAKVLVEAIGADGSTRVLATRHDEARAEIDRLLGLTREQFCQVVLLPQGEFATFLRARSEDRKELLTQLFSAERFGLAEEWLAKRRRLAEAQVSQAADGVSDVVSRLAEVTGEEAPEGWREDPDLLAAWLGERRVVADAQRETATEVREGAAQAEQAADAVLQAALALVERRERHARAVALQEQLEAGASRHVERGAELAAARKAAVVVPLLRDAATRAEQAAAACAEGERLLALAGSTATDAAALRAAGADVRRAAGEAQALTAIETQLRERRAALDVAQRELQEQRTAAAELADWLARAERERGTLAARAEETAQAAAGLEALRTEAARASERAAKALERDTALARMAQQTTLRDAAREAAQDARQAWLDAREARLAGMAAELADGLAPGDPCSVCGALDHPAPAMRSADAVRVDAETEERAAQDYERRAALLEEAGRALADSAAAHAAARAVAGEDDAAALRAEAQRRQGALEAAEGLASAAPAAAAALTAHETTTAQKAVRHAELADALARGEARLAELTTVVQADAQRLAQALGDVADVASLVAGLEARAARLDAAAQAVDHARQAVAEAERTRVAADAEAVAHGFGDAAEARAAARDDAAIATLEQARREHDDRVAECRAALADPELREAAAAAPPDVTAAQRAKREASEALARAEGDLARAAAHADRLIGLERHLAERLEQLAPLREQARRIRDLAMLADGSSTANRKRMRLSAYVLAAQLEEIAAAASVRLESMSGGRYTLIHSDEGARRARQHGLDLRVVDGWTGQERHPSTLSGGETFLASLALALGLADVVSAEAGGARLETLFVDEGFGSLDDAALDEVLDVLDRLRDGGRSVGVVSHVAELRQRITAQLHVVKGRDGSHVVQPTAVA